MSGKPIDEFDGVFALDALKVAVPVAADIGDALVQISVKAGSVRAASFAGKTSSNRLSSVTEAESSEMDMDSRSKRQVAGVASCIVRDVRKLSLEIMLSTLRHYIDQRRL